MNYKDAGFRPFYHHFVAVPIKDSLRPAIQDFPGAKAANYLLAYGYIDRSCGLTLEILAMAQKTSKGFRFADTNESIRSFIRIGAIEEDECLYFPDEKDELAKRYASKLDIVREYNAPEDVEKSREMIFLDGCRDKE